MITVGNLPPAITGSRRAVLWNPEQRNGKSTKVPYQVRAPKAHAAVDDPRTWASFTEAYRAYRDKQAHGIGIVLDGSDRLIGVDLDHCRHPGTGVIEPWARAIIDTLSSYTEASPSGTGIRIFVYGELPPHGRKNGPIEVYARGKYLTVTGDWIPGTPKTIEDRTAALRIFHASVFGEPAPAEPERPPREVAAHDLSDRELLDRIARSGQSDRFAALWRNDPHVHPGDPSAGDLALCNMLAFWTDRDPGRMDGLFRQSARMRAKWDERHYADGRTYGAATIDKAIADCRETYQPIPDVVLEDDQADRPSPSPAPARRLSTDAYLGPIGEYVRAVEEQTEADPVGVLLQMLVMFGSVVGRTPHAKVAGDAHRLNEYVLLVGPTGSGSKGLSHGIAREPFRLCDPEWSDRRVLSGLSSGEGLIHAVRDPVMGQEPVRERGGVTGYIPVLKDAGVDDKRAYVYETEFARSLAVMRREGSTLSAVVRQAWDDGHLHVLTKTPLVATGAHISIVAHITATELIHETSSVSLGNGLLNRFLIVPVRRARELPEGGEIAPGLVSTCAEQLEQAVAAARRCDAPIRRDAEAITLWKSAYSKLTRERPGLVGALAARAHAHTLRLSLIYALTDGSSVVQVPHLKAALAVWEYVEDGIRQIFGDRTGHRLADYLLRLIRSAGAAGVTKTEISEACGRHRAADEISAALLLLRDYGLAVSEKQPQPDGQLGRPTVRWYARGGAKEAK